MFSLYFQFSIYGFLPKTLQEKLSPQNHQTCFPALSICTLKIIGGHRRSIITFFNSKILYYCIDKIIHAKSLRIKSKPFILYNENSFLYSRNSIVIFCFTFNLFFVRKPKYPFGKKFKVPEHYAYIPSGQLFKTPELKQMFFLFLCQPSKLPTFITTNF